MSHSQGLQTHLDRRMRADTIGYPGSMALLTLKPLKVYCMADNYQSVMHWPWLLDEGATKTEPAGGISPNFKTWDILNTFAL